MAFSFALNQRIFGMALLAPGITRIDEVRQVTRSAAMTDLAV